MCSKEFVKESNRGSCTPRPTKLKLGSGPKARRLLVQDMRRVADELGTQVLTNPLYRQYGAYSHRAAERLFGKWGEAIEMAGLYHGTTVPDDALVDDLERVAVLIAPNRLTINRYQKHGKYSHYTAIERFGNWPNVLNVIGLSRMAGQHVTNSQILDDLVRVAKKTGSNRLTQAIYRRHGRYSHVLVINRLGWSKGVRLAGLEPGRGGRGKRKSCAHPAGADSFHSRA